MKLYDEKKVFILLVIIYLDKCALYGEILHMHWKFVLEICPSISLEFSASLTMT